MKGAKSIIKSLLGEQLIGRIDYYLKPSLSRDRLPFNGQTFRRKIFEDLFGHFGFGTIVETGTFRGTTTALFAEKGVPVYTVEAHPRYFGFASARFQEKKEAIHLLKGDSRKQLRRILERESLSRNVFFYLDAHWEEDLPLNEEVDIIFEKTDGGVAMIDDFEVPGTEYGVDDYGGGEVLNTSYLAEVLRRHDLDIFFPSMGIEAETGEQRGCAVVCQSGPVSNKISENIETLSKWEN